MHFLLESIHIFYLDLQKWTQGFALFEKENQNILNVLVMMK